MKSKEAMAGLSEGQLAEASEEGLGLKGAVVPMMMMYRSYQSTASISRCKSLFYPEDACSKFLRYVGTYQPHCTVSHTETLYC